MNFFYKISIKNKLIGIILSVTLSSLALGFTVVIINDTATFKKDMMNNIVMEARLVSEYCISALAFQDREGAADILKKLKSNPKIIYGFLYDKNEKLFASYSRSGAIPKEKIAGASIKEMRLDLVKEDFVEVAQKIIYQDYDYGTFSLVASTEELNKKIVQYFTTMSILIFGLVVLSYVLSLFFQKIISKPILKLAGVTEEISMRPDYSLRVQRRSDDEIGILYNRFNEMISQIENRSQERDRAEEALRESESKYSTLVENANEGVAITQDNIFIFINSAMVDITDFTDKELLTMNIFDLIVLEEREMAAKIIKSPLNSNDTPIEYETKLVCRNGNIKEVIIFCTTIRYQSVLARMFVIRDITERKRAEEELRNHRDHLEYLVRERTNELEAMHKELLIKEKLATLGELTATVSHELRNPLGTIRTSVYSLKERIKEKDGSIMRAFDRTERNILRCDRIIEELLDYTRVKSLNIESTNIDQWLKAVLNEQRVPGNIRVVHELNADIKLMIDRDRFHRCLINIIDNACQAIVERMEKQDGKGTTTQENSLIISSRVQKDRMEVWIKDTGAGIKPEILERIFEPLYSTKGFGVGLGLAIVKQIMERHNGGVDVMSREGNGTTFILWLPVYNTLTNDNNSFNMEQEKKISN